MTLVTKIGTDPNCVHDEWIDADQRGTCKKCGQVKDYRQVPYYDRSLVKPKKKEVEQADGNH